MKQFSLIALTLTLSSAVWADSFTTDGNGLRTIVSANVGGESVLYVSEVDGAVACYTASGQKRWSHPTATPAVMFELQAADVDGDGNDDLLAASGDGHIYCWGSDGVLRWKFDPGHKVRFSEVACVRAGHRVQIFAGGNDFLLYELNADGKLVSQTKIDGVVRKIEAGHFLAKDHVSLFLMTYSHDKFHWAFFGFLDPESKGVEKSLTSGKASAKDWDRLMVTDVSVRDLDGDQRDDLLIFGDGGDATAGAARFMAFNGDFQRIANFSGPSRDKQRYAHVRGQCLLPVRPEIALQYGGILYVCDLKGKLLHTGGAKYRGIVFNDLALDAGGGQLLGAGQVGGGNSIYRYPLAHPNWWEIKPELKGRMLDVENNLLTLYEQSLAFTPPAYQRPATKPWVVISGPRALPAVERLKTSELVFVKQYTWHEDFDRAGIVAAIGEDALKKDRRGNYTVTREAIVQIAREHEAQGRPFAAWAGHGTDPFYLSLETMEAVLAVAPLTCYGFVFAEMANPEDKRITYFVDHIMPRLAAACRQNGKARLYFRYKNVFWAATAHLEPWNRVFLSGKYRDVVVPASEDTNSRTQDINFVGRVGLLAGGYVDDIAMRLIDDNPTSWRPLSPGGQRSVSPYLRNGVLLAAYGAHSAVLFDIGFLEDPGMNILYALMKSGVLPDVKPADLLAIGSWHLIQNVDSQLVDSIDGGHEMEQGKPADEAAVVSVGQVGWCGVNLPAHDFSRLLGVGYRWLNFLPAMPYGMVPIAPIALAEKLKRQGVPYTVSDFRQGFVEGKPVPAMAYGETLASTVRAGAKQLPVLVSGAAWSAIRLDARHTRLILVDPGYIDPQDRQVTVTFQGSQPVSATDILSHEQIAIVGKAAKLTVPAGAIRCVDLAY